MPERITSEGFMKKNKKKVIFSTLFFLLFAIPFFALGSPLDPLGGQYSTLPELVTAIVNFIGRVAIVLTPLVFIYAGLQYYFSTGDPDKAKKAADAVKWGIVGLGIIIVAEGIIYVIEDVLLN